MNKFQILPESELSTDQIPYDYLSVMHPSLFMDTINQQPTIERIRPLPEEPENLPVLTDLDFLHIKLVYGKGVANFPNFH